MKWYVLWPTVYVDRALKAYAVHTNCDIID